MASEATTLQMIDIGLTCALGTTTDLSEVVDQWPSMQDGERASWSLEWDQMTLGDMQRLSRHHLAGNMTPAQETRYRQLLNKLRDAMPLSERLNLARPWMLGE